MPSGKLVRIGVWENKKYIGCILFGRGANNNLGKPYGLEQTQVCELVRVALNEHIAPVSRILAIAIRVLTAENPGLRLIVSYADPEQGHHGGTYQAGGWIYDGRSQPQREVVVNGKVMHKRTANALFGSIKGLEKSKVFWKHKYLMPLDPGMRAQIMPLAKPYPKRMKPSSEAAGYQPAEGGAEPTHTLQNKPICKGAIMGITQ